MFGEPHSSTQPHERRATTEAPSDEASAPHDAGVSRVTCLQLVLLFGPLVLLVVLTRLLEYSFVMRSGIPPLRLLLSSAGLAPLVLLGASLGIYVGLRARWPRLRAAWRVGLTSLATAGLVVAGAWLAPDWTTEWLSPRAFEAIRWDVLLLLLTALAFLFLLERTRGWTRILSLALLYVLVVWLMMVAVLSFGYFIATGSPPDGTLMRYFLLHLPDLLGVMLSEAHGPRVLLLALPPVVLLLPLLLLRVSVVRRWAEVSHASATPLPWHVLWATLPVLLVLVLPPRVPLPGAYEAGTYVGLMEGLVRRVSATVPTHAAPTPPPFDTENLTLTPTDSTRRMNVVVILLESTRSRSTTPYNPALDTTPFLDSLAHHALLVEQMYAVVPYTNKALTPVLAGIYPYPHREIVENRPGVLPGPGLPELLRPLGYRSAFFTPADLSYERKDLILKNLGFDDMYGNGAYPTDGFEKDNYFGYEDRIVIAPSMTWVDACTAAGEPFFLTYLTLTAHHPYHVPSSFPKHDYGVDDPSLNNYLNAVRYTDAFLRDLFQAFARRGLLDTTVFIILGDHGQAFGEHMQRMHNDVLWDETLQVPALVYNPVLFPTGRRIQGRRQQIDVLPTVADLLHLRPEDGVYPGRSLLDPVPPGRTLYHSGWESNVALALRRDSLKYLYRFQERPMQVFNVADDPMEHHNLAGQLPPDDLRTAEQQVLHWRRSVQHIYVQRLRSLSR